MPLSSNSLFHYTRGGMKAIKGILETGFRVSYPTEPEYHIHTIGHGIPDGDQGIPNEHEEFVMYPRHNFAHYLHMPMVSFCDIPISLVNNHLADYGTTSPNHKKMIGYAIGIKKNWAISNHIDPILYLVPQSELAKSLSSGSSFPTPPDIEHDSNNRYLRSEEYMKPLPMNRNGELLMDNKGGIFPRIALYSKFIGYRHAYDESRKVKKFMDEREWRFVPHDAKIIHSKIFLSGSINQFYYSTIVHNAERAVGESTIEGYPNLEFEIDDINHIVVGFDSEIPEVQEIIRKEFKEKRKVDDEQLYLLFSKVTSYETLERDFFSH